MPTRCRAMLLAVAMGLLTASGGSRAQDTDTPPAPEPAADAPEKTRQRVIVRVNRNREVPGYVQWQDDEFILIEKLDGETESFSKTRVASVVWLVEPVENQGGVVFLRDGQVREGVIVSDGFDEVIVEIDGIRSRLPRELVDRVTLQPTFQQRYEQYKLSVRTPHQHMQLCKWLVDNRRYELAQTELTQLIRENPVPPAIQLMRVVEAHLAMQPRTRESPDGTEAPIEDDGLGSLALPVLTHDEVNLIRVYEVDFDRPPKVQIDPDTIHRMIEQYAENRLIPAGDSERRALFRADPVDLVALMFELRARSLYPDIQVLTEPYALNLFRRRVHNAWLMNTCATARCHGGVHAGEFFLHRRRYKDERVRYANLLILHRLETDPEWALVNYDEPMMSLIIQYGLPRSDARLPHPDVNGWKPVFNRGGGRLLQESIEWIESMMQPRPAYPVEYEPPRPGEPDPDPADEDTPESPFGEPEGERVPR